MLIDWFTVIAQALNFLILVWLLKRFLYKPILQVMDEREKRIAASLREAEEQKAEAYKERSHFQQMNSELEQKRESLLQQARADAEAEGRRLMEAAREGHRALRARLQEALRSEQLKLSRGIIRRFQEETFAIARKVLADLADTSLEEQMASVFVRQIQGLDEEARKRLAASLQSSGQAASVRTTFPLSDAQQRAIEGAVRKVAGADKTLQFELAPNANGQAGSIELFTDGYKMAWSVTDYLRSLEQSIGEMLEGEPEQRPKTNDHG